MNVFMNLSARCPRCKSSRAVQVHRLRIEKWVTPKNKYECADCGKQFFILQEDTLSTHQKPLPPSESFFHFFRS